MRLALFDMDGTITTKDSLIRFLIYSHGYPKYLLGMLLHSHYLFAYKLGIYPNYKAKEKIISHFFRGWRADQFQRLAQQYSSEELDKITRPKAMQRIQWHHEQGHKIVVVSASIEDWLAEWCNKHGVELISTQLKYHNDCLTGEFATKNCYGAEKVARIKARYDLSKFDYIYAYGDSSGDKEMLNLANEKFYKIF